MKKISSNLDLLLLKNRAKLEKMILSREDYNKIVKQSQKLDTLIYKKFNLINN